LAFRVVALDSVPAMLWLRGLSALAASFAGLALAEDSCPAGAGATCKAASDSASRNERAAKPYVMPTADLITQELQELAELKLGAQERIELLEELKLTVNSGIDLALPQSHVRMLQQQLPLMSEVVSDQHKAPTGSADDYLFSKAVILQADPVSFIKWLPLKSRGTSSMSSPSDPTSMPTTLLVAAQADGRVRLFTPSGELVLSFSADHQQPITNLAVSQTDDSWVATADAGGSVRVHKVNARMLRAGKESKNATDQTTEKVSRFLSQQLNITAQFTAQMQVPPSSEGEPVKLTTLAVSSQQGAKFFVAGDEEGKVSVFTRNGTFVTQLDVAVTQGAKIEMLHSHLSYLLFHTGYEWGFINLERLEVQHLECPPFEGRITSVVLDSQKSSRVMLADDEGVVWVFDVKNRKKCKLEHRFPKGIADAPLDLASLHGYTIALERAAQGRHANAVLAINMSHVGSSSAVRSPVAWRRGMSVVRDWAVLKRYQQGDLAAFLSEDGREVEVVELLMHVYQAPRASEDAFGNFKMPVIAVAVALVLGYQYMKQKGNFGGGKGAMKKGGGGLGKGSNIDWDKEDLKGLREKIAKKRMDSELTGSKPGAKKTGGLGLS